MQFVLALLLPWGLGIATSAAVSPRRDRIEHVARGWFLGQALVIGALYAMLRAGWTIGPGMATLGVVALAAVAGIAGLLARRGEPTHAVGLSELTYTADAAAKAALCRDEQCTPRARAVMRLLIAIGAALVVVKLIAIGFAACLAPIRHDDATVIWLLRAKVIAGLGRLVLDPADPLYLGATHADYPLGASLVAAWMAVVGGRWSEAWVTLPWHGFYANLLLLIFAWLRRVADWRAGCLAAYVVGSLPLLAAHAMRPGYADLLLAAFLAAATIELCDWLREPRGASFVAGMAFCVAAAWMKREGTILACGTALVLGAGGLFALPRTWRVVLPAVVIAAAAVACSVPWQFLGSTASGLGYHPEAWTALKRHVGTWSSFGLFWIAVVAVMIPVLLAKWEPAHRRWLSLPILVLVLAAISAAPFVLTDNIRFALNDQTPGRSFMQVAPSVAVVLGLSAIERFGRRRSGAIAQ